MSYIQLRLILPTGTLATLKFDLASSRNVGIGLGRWQLYLPNSPTHIRIIAMAPIVQRNHGNFSKITENVTRTEWTEEVGVGD